MTARKVPRTVVPATIEGVMGLLVARKWDKAAIVYAWTEPQQGTSPKNRRSNLHTLADFAELGIVGLRDKDTVAAYRKNWVWAIENGLAEMVAPGDEINLDDLEGVDFPATTVTYTHPHVYDADYEAEAEAVGITKDAVRRTAANKKAIEAAIVADPEAAQAARRGLDKRIAKQAERFRAKQRAAGVRVDDLPEPATVIDPIVNLAEGMIDEGRRREGLDRMLSLAVQLANEAADWSEQFGYTGVADEVEQVQQISHYLTEAQWKVATFAVASEQRL